MDEFEMGILNLFLHFHIFIPNQLIFQIYNQIIAKYLPTWLLQKNLQHYVIILVSFVGKYI